MYSQRATQCATSAHMHSQIGEWGLLEKKNYEDEIQTENYLRGNTKNDLYYRGKTLLIQKKCLKINDLFEVSI